MQQMHQQSGRMQTLLNDLLLLAKLEATDYPSDNQPVPIDDLLQTIVEDAQELSGSKQQTITLEADPAVQLKGSEAELRSAFSNLVFNAVKYTPEQGRIHVRWWGDEQGAHLSVRDSGIGIDSKHLPRLTERFYRVDSSRNSNTGAPGWAWPSSNTSCCAIAPAWKSAAYPAMAAPLPAISPRPR